MVAERFNISPSEDPSTNPGWDNLRWSLPEASGATPDSATDKKKKKKTKKRNGASATSDASLERREGQTGQTEGRADREKKAGHITLDEMVIWERSDQDNQKKSADTTSDDILKTEKVADGTDASNAPENQEASEASKISEALETSDAPDIPEEPGEAAIELAASHPEYPVDEVSEQHAGAESVPKLDNESGAYSQPSAEAYQPAGLYMDEGDMGLRPGEGADVPPVPPPLPPFPPSGAGMGEQPSPWSHQPQEEPLRTIRPESVQPPRHEGAGLAGYQRTPADVSRAAWTGLLAGRWLGARGKRRATEQAHKTGFEAGIASTQSELEALQYRLAEQQSQQPHAERPAAVPSASYGAERAGEAPLTPVDMPLPSRATEHDRREPYEDRAPGSTEKAPVFGVSSERQLGKRELMQVAKEIKIDGIRLKDIFETGRIDEEGMRAVVDTYLRGGDVRQRLTRELVAKERSFERDPRLRHMRMPEDLERNAPASDHEVGARKDTTAKKPSHNQEALRETGALVSGSAQKAAKSTADAIARGAKIVHHDLIDNSNTTDWISVTAVVVLWSIILILLLQ